jgi:periplasmic protein TonB
MTLARMDFSISRPIIASYKGPRTRGNRVASAVDTSVSNSSPSAGSKPISSFHPVAHEVRVIVSGARPAAASGGRELFTEATTTVLVSENGAVIRLSAAVAPGQLLFLINQDSRREVVAQVLRKRYFRPTNCYVELQFTEAAPGFWGMEFPATPNPAHADAQQLQAVERVQSAEATDDDPGESTPAPSAQEAGKLRQEVDLLRDQLQALLQSGPGAANSPVADALPLSPPGPGAVVTSRIALPVLTPQELPNASVVMSRLPIEPPDSFSKSAFSDANLLPKPQAATWNATSSAKRSSKASAKATEKVVGTARTGPMRIIPFAAVLLLVAVGTAWYLHLLPGMPLPKFVSAHSPSLPVHAANSASPSSALPSAQKTDPRADSPNAAQISADPAAQPSATTHDASSPTVSLAPVAAETPSALSAAQPASAADPASFSALAKENASVVSVVKRSSLPPPVKTSLPSSAFGEQGSVVPPKLIKSVQGFAPPEAIRGFVAGNVILDALVGPTGRVISTTVLSGRPSLRASATETLKQYRYQPATENGRPVSAHVTVTIQCWFEP